VGVREAGGREKKRPAPLTPLRGLEDTWEWGQRSDVLRNGKRPYSSLNLVRRERETFSESRGEKGTKVRPV